MNRASFLSEIRRFLFTGWEVREKILRPVIVNLLTAILIFLIAVIFRDRIYDYFVPRHEVKEWPIYCVIEPEASNGPVTADLFVLNLTAKKYLKNDLDNLAREQSPPNGTPLSALIDIEVKDSVKDGAISGITGDDEFNREKGSATANRVDQRHWQIQTEEIKEGKILKFVIHTTVERPISSRASFETLPIKITYARSR